MDDLIIRAAIIDEMSAPLDRLETDLRSLARAVLAVDRRFDGLVRSSGSAGRAARKVTEEQARLQRQTDATARAVGRLDAAMMNVTRRGGAGLLAVARRGVQGLGILATAAAGFGAKTALSVQSARGAFENFSTNPAALLAQVQGLDATKALGIGTTASAASKLGAFGIAESAIPASVTALTDAAFLQGSEGATDRLQRITLALGQVQAKGRIQAEEALQFAEAGIPIYEKLAAAIGLSQAETLKLLSTQEGSQKVYAKIGGAAGLAQIIGSGNTKGAASRSINSTLSGQIKSRVQGFGGAVAIGALPTLDRLTKLLAGNQGGLNGFEKTVTRVVGQTLPKLLNGILGFWSTNGRTITRELRQLGRDFMSFARFAGPVVADALTIALPALFGLTRTIGFLSRVLRPVSFLIVPLVAGLGALMVASKVARGIQAATTAMAAFGVVMNVLKAAALTNPYVLIAAAVVGLAVGLVVLYRRSERFRNFIQAVGRAGRSAFGWIADSVKNVIGWVQKAIGWIAQMYDKIPGPIKAALNIVMPGAAAVDAASSLNWAKPEPGAVTAQPGARTAAQTGVAVTVQSNNQFNEGVTREEVVRISGAEAGKAFDTRERNKRER